MSDVETKRVSTRLVVGAIGWFQPGWEKTYFPDDLPSDWQMSYYANDFRLVGVPHGHWHEPGPDELEDWLDDVPENFSFILYLDKWQEQTEARLRVLRSGLSAVVASADVLAQHERELRQILPVEVALQADEEQSGCVVRCDASAVPTDLKDLNLWLSDLMEQRSACDECYLMLDGLEDVSLLRKINDLGAVLGIL